MSSAEVLSPSPPSMTPAVVRPRRGLASIKTMFSTKRHTIAQIPDGTEDLTSASTPTSTPVAIEDSPLSTPSTATSSGHQKTSSSVSSLFAANPKKTLEKQAEKEKKAQEKAAIQLSIVDDHGAFLPPTPLEKGIKDHFKDNEEDYFMTIISTPPDRVRSFLSAASTISPGMFSTPASKIKRHSIGSFPPLTTRHVSQPSWSSSQSSSLSIEEETEEEIMTSPPVPPKDEHYAVPTKTSHPNSTRRVQASSFLTGGVNNQFDDLTDALSESIGSSFLPASPSQSVPDLMDDDDEHSGSDSSTSSPRHSTASLDTETTDRKKKVQDHAFVEESLGGDLRLSH
ncbi:hypothetical protein BGZ83_009997 [Gryganskiella cystojenkinii]|nr:hypothetical protein BGZ83_009997 [Gryganskiella cystojenkinii]